MFVDQNRDIHNYQCSSLNGTLHDHYATAYGIHRDSKLNSSQYFHVTEGLVPDAMHDVLEGCAQYEVKELLKYFRANHDIPISYVNDQIKNFPYSPSDIRDKPTEISESFYKLPDHSLKVHRFACITYIQFYCIKFTFLLVC